MFLLSDPATPAWMPAFDKRAQRNQAFPPVPRWIPHSASGPDSWNGSDPIVGVDFADQFFGYECA